MKSQISTLTFALAVGLVFSGLATAQNPVPLINEPLAPDAAMPGGAGFTLTVNGTGFVSTSVVKWNGGARTTKFVSNSQLKANISVSDIAKAGTAFITVVNPSPGGGRSNTIFFDVTRPSSTMGLSAPTSLSAGSGPNEMAVGDFNGDGNLDMAVANYGSNNVSIFLGNGDGTFRAAAEYGAGQIEYGLITVGDFNADGKLDLAVSDYGTNNVSVLLGNGDGTFRGAVTYGVGTNPGGIVAGDFNRDGKLDLVVVNQDCTNGGPPCGVGTVSVLLGNGDGTFQPHKDYPAGSNPNTLTVGDFNRDGKLDLAIANGNSVDASTVSVLLGNGDGTFQAPVSYTLAVNAVTIETADFNGDGNLDLALVDNIGTLWILLGKGDGTFKILGSYGTDSFPAGLAVADLNGDGKLDLAVGSSGSNTLQVFLGNGDGTFQSPLRFAAGSFPEGLAAADFDKSGRLDLAVTNKSSDVVSILLQTPTVSLSQTNLTFANQLVGSSSASQTVTLTNTTGLTLKISSIAVTGTNSTDFRQADTCDSVLLPGRECTITVTFGPTQTGQRTASITITDNAVDSPQSIALSGTGVVSGPNVTLSATSLTFSTQLIGTTSPVQSVTLSDYGTMVLSIASIGFTGADPGDFTQTKTCGSSITPGASCTINVTFKPAQSGARTANLSITDNAPGSPQTVGVTGVGTVVQLNPASLSFGVHPVGSSSTRATTLTNVGSSALRLTGIVIAGADTDEFRQANTCGTGVGAGKSCTITVTFTPRDQRGDSAEVSISDNGGGSPQLVSLSGAGCVYGYRHKCWPLIGSPAVQSALTRSRSTAVPSVTGANRVGTRIIDLVDSSRIDPFATNGLNRELLVRFWYPASAEQDCKLADYTSPRVWNLFADLTGLPLPSVTTNSCLDAPVADGEHPVVVFTHGYTGTFTDYSFIFEDLASRGYVVASVDHTYEATAVAFPDGRFVKSLVGSHLTNTWQTDNQTLSSALDVRLDDLKFVIDELERLNTSSGTAFAGRLDLTRLALAGHSLGGLTAWFGVQRDPRFKAAVLLDPYLPDIPVGSTETPVMLLTMGSEQRNEDECQLWSDLLGPRLSVNLRGAEHVTPSDLVWLAKGAVKTGPMGPEKTVAAVRDYITAFLDANLRDRPAGRLLSGPSAEYPDAVVTTQEQSLCRKP